MINPIIRYWIKLNKRSEPIETDDLKMMRRDLSRSPDAMIITEALYPNAHEFKLEGKMGSPIRERISREMSDSERSNEATRLFNKINQYESQVIRKKKTAAKPHTNRKTCSCKKK